MLVVKVAGVLVGTLLLLQNVSGHGNCVCKCAPHGLFGDVDVCSHQAPPTGPLVVRPKQLKKPTITLPLFGSSGKGPCFRRQTIVKPAVVPRPVYVQAEADNCNHQYNNNDNLASAAAVAAQLLSHAAGSTITNSITQQSCGSSTGSFLGGSGSASHVSSFLGGSGSQCPGVQGIDVASAYEKACSGAQAHTGSAPADAVSVAIAYKLAQENCNNNINEDRLTYGFRKLPLEQPILKQKQLVYKQILPEDSLYALNGQIVELKPVCNKHHSTCGASLSEEAQDELLDLAMSEEAIEAQHVRRPSLCDLGYGPAKLSSATFVDVPSAPSAADVAAAAATAASAGASAVNAIAGAVSGAFGAAGSLTTGGANCNDGFKSGTVEFRDFAKHEPMCQHHVSHHVSAESQEQEEAVRHITVPAPSCTCNGNPAGVFHHFARSTKSSTTSHKHGVMMGKLCN